MNRREFTKNAALGVVVATTAGLHAATALGREPRPADVTLPEHQQITAVCHHLGRLWMATDQRRLYSWDGTSIRMEQRDMPEVIRHLFSFQGDLMAFGTSGFYRFDPQ